MKKNLLLFIAVLFASTTFSQISFGIRAGLNYATMSGKEKSNDDSEHKAVKGIIFGAVLEQHATDVLSIQYELLYLQKGLKIVYDNSSWYFSNKIQFNSLEIPILLKFTFGEGLKFYGNIGPYFNYALNGKYNLKSEIGNTTTTEYGKIIFDEQPDDYTGKDYYYDPDKYRRFDYGLYFGGGLGMKLGPGLLSLDVRYGIGFAEFYKDAYFDVIQVDGTVVNIVPSGYEAYKNRNLSISLSYMFGGK